MATCLVSDDGQQSDDVVIKTVRVDQLQPLLALSDERCRAIVENSLLFTDLELL